MCSIGDVERAKVWQVTARRSRTDHQCKVCCCDIQPDTLYHEVNSMFDGVWDRARVHPECHDLAKVIQLDACDRDICTLLPMREDVAEHLDHPGVLKAWRTVVRNRMADGTWRRPLRRGRYT